MTQHEHPFATYIRILGKGQKGSRGLTRAEAYTAMGMLLDGKIEDTQLGAFLMLLRFKEETAEELAGFAQAVQKRVQAPKIQVDLDWPSYAGKKRQLPWYLLAIKALAQSGVRVFIHGGGQHTDGRLYTEDLLETLGIPHCNSWYEVSQALDKQNVAYMGLGQWMPRLQRCIELRNTLGLRSPVHSLARLLNPLQAHCVLQGIFHPNYQPIQQQANVLLGQRSLVIKGDGGEIEVRPDATGTLMGATDGQAWDEEWPAQIARQVKAPTLEPQRLLALWQGQDNDIYGEQAIIATIALGLRGLGQKRDEAFAQAQKIWQAR
ncbi:glycosyl transferase family protein [Thiopseudomonas acetoxidans]|uniref:Glycosyl transferase family protein n=1 Tax=Thiopseudomonas acetoxidans TaxID=3041622 RepID=A0ABT7SPG3_9GAMM|nr:glycosyl transferase family protein [Thiopseudomonas sp. CY1220]MDM7858093.1 glycosyl transferase family protein [Thiopseudomonas sp. CY1220]